ncbi:hypothetical protein FISHEDRAFT_21260, partial [Fistulina hepatica ATCC 64428]
SRDLRWAAVNLYAKGLFTTKEIASICNFSPRTFYRIIKIWRETGDVFKESTALRGRPRLLAYDDIDYLLRLIEFNPTWFVDELQELLQHNRLVAVHYATICHTLERCGISAKKLKICASERNENVRLDHIRQAAAFTPEQIGFIDETSKDNRTVFRIGFLTLEGMSASKVVEGSMTRDIFLEWFEHQVV